MSYSTLKNASLREGFIALEIDLDINDPALDATISANEAGSMGTPKTTLNAFAYTGTDFRTYRYTNTSISDSHLPGLKNASFTQPRIDPGKSIGLRAACSITLKDFIDGDEYALPFPYDDRRVTGSHWEKLISRNYFNKRQARVLVGYDPDNFSASNAQVHHFVIDSITGPDLKGNISIQLVDQLILADYDSAQVLETSVGTLKVDLLEVDLELGFDTTVTDEYGGVGTTGKIALGKEIMDYTVLAGNKLSLVRNAPERKKHEAGTLIQKCLVFEQQNVIDAITTLIGRTQIPASYIPSEWATLKAGVLKNNIVSNVIAKQVSVKKQLDELVQLSGLSMFVDVINQEIVIKPAPDFTSPIIAYTPDEHLIAGSWSAKEDRKRWTTRATIRWAPVDYAATSEVNFGRAFTVIEGLVEGGAQENDIKQAKEIKTKWLGSTVAESLFATTVVQREIQQFGQVPFTVKFKVDASHAIGLGDVFTVKAPNHTEGKTHICQCIGVKINSDDTIDIQGATYGADESALSIDYTIASDKTDYVLADDPAFSPILGAAREYIVVIAPGVTIGPTSTAIDAFTQGTFPVGATLRLINRGVILGKPGAGGKGGRYAFINEPGTRIINYYPGQPGLDASSAISLSTDCIIDNVLGTIGGGGGGGGGGPAGQEIGGHGGGGGQGFGGSLGGDGGDLLFGDPGELSDGLDGPDGTIDSPGRNAVALPNNGGNGGALGQDGERAGILNGIVGGAGGKAGAAIKANGFGLSITGGNNPEQLMGEILDVGEPSGGAGTVVENRPTNLNFTVSTDATKMGTVTWDMPDDTDVVSYTVYLVKVDRNTGGTGSTVTADPIVDIETVVVKSYNIENVVPRTYQVQVQANFADLSNSTRAKLYLDLLRVLPPIVMSTTIGSTTVTLKPTLTGIDGEAGLTFEYDIVEGDGTGHSPVANFTGQGVTIPNLPADTQHTVFVRTRVQAEEIVFSPWQSFTFFTLVFEVDISPLEIDITNIQNEIDTLNINLETVPAILDSINRDILEQWERRKVTDNLQVEAETRRVALVSVNSDLDTLNDVTIPGINQTIAAAEADLDTLNTVTIPGINSDIDSLEGLFPITSTSVSDSAITTPKLAANSVDASKIVALSITGAQIAALAISADKIVTNTITADQIAALTITGAQIAALAISADKITANAITADKINANAVTTTKISAGAVTATRIATGTITANEIAASTITGSKIAADTLTASNIAALTITGAEIAALAISTDKIVANAITAAKIDALAITSDKIAANAITSAKIDAGAITATKIAVGAITADSVVGDTAAAGSTALTTKNITSAAGEVTISEFTVNNQSYARDVIIPAPWFSSDTPGTSSRVSLRFYKNSVQVYIDGLVGGDHYFSSGPRVESLGVSETATFKVTAEWSSGADASVFPQGYSVAVIRQSAQVTFI